jgi:hypothetical protein
MHFLTIVVCKEAKLPLIRFSYQDNWIDVEQCIEPDQTLLCVAFTPQCGWSKSRSSFFLKRCQWQTDSHVVKSFSHPHVSFFGLALWKKRINSSFICGYSIIVVGGSRYLNRSISRIGRIMNNRQKKYFHMEMLAKEKSPHRWNCVNICVRRLPASLVGHWRRNDKRAPDIRLPGFRSRKGISRKALEAHQGNSLAWPKS